MSSKIIENIANSFKKNKVYIPKTSPQIMQVFFKEYDEKTGIMQIGENLYSVCYEYTDVSFSKANQETQTSLFLKYVDYLNSLDANMHIEVVHCGLPVATKTYKEEYIYTAEDGVSENVQKLIKEFNEGIESNLGSKQTTFCETRLIVVSIIAETFDEAKDFFFQYQMTIEESFALFKSSIRKCSIQERLKFLYNIFHLTPFVLDYPNDDNIVNLIKEKNISVYDFLAPKEEISFKEKDYISIDDKKFLKIMYVSKFPTSISPEFYNSLTTLQEFNLTVTENITAKDPAYVLNKLEKKISGLQTERLEKIKRANKNNYNYEYVKDQKLEDQLANYEGLRKALSKKKQKLFEKNILILIQAESLNEMELAVKKIKTIASKYLVEISCLDWQQLEGLQNVLPFGHNTLQFQRSLHSEAVATSVPFNSKTVCYPKSIWYGTDLVSKKMLCCDRKKLLNGNGCILATSGSGKSFFAKTDLEQVAIRYPKDEIVVIDPQNEYEAPLKAFEGESQTIKISTTANTHINPFDMELQYVSEDKDPIKTKIEFVLAFMASIVGNLTGEQESIIDRATKKIYEDYEMTGKNKPSFPVFYQELKSYEETEAKNLVLILERYVKGGMDLFSKDTNIEINKRIVSFDLSDLTQSMQTTGYLVILEHIMNRVAKNKMLGRNTWVYIDEFHILLENPYSSNYIARIYKTGRKMGVLPTIITQRISNVLNSEAGCDILANSEFAVILKQKALDLKAICNIFDISPEEASYCSLTAQSGQGLIVYGHDIVPFKNVFSKESYIYELNNTDSMQKVRE